MAAAIQRHWLFMKRTWLGAAVAVGVLLGINIPEFWKFTGSGGSGITGLGTPSANAPSPKEADEEEARSNARNAVSNDTATATVQQAGLIKPSEMKVVPPVVKVVIAERDFSLRLDEGDRPVEVNEIISLVKRAAGDTDGIKLKVFREPSSRPSAEMALQSALSEGGIPESAVVWVPTATE